MKRIAGLLAAPVAVLAVGVGVAVAATSPTVSTGPAKKISNTSESLSATINPNGASTGYVFQYGLTSAYGLQSASHSAGSGRKPVTVTAKVTGLLPGTVYHYRVAALSKAGGTFGKDRSFKTAGPPPAAVETGPPSSVRKTMATVTGTINPNHAATTWEVQYGPTTAYTVHTFRQALSAGTAPVPVSAMISNLAPAELFHYRIVAFHASIPTYGADQTFFTEPDHRPAARVRARTKPGRDRRRPYTFTTSGIVRGGSYIPPAARCGGSVGLRYYARRRQVAFVLVPVGSDCRFTAQATIRRRAIHGPTPLRIAIHFRGNGYLAPGNRTDHVVAG